MRKQYSGQVKAQRKETAHSELGCRPAFSEVSSCRLLKPAPAVGSLPPWQHSCVCAGVAGTMRRSRGPGALWLQVREGVCFLCALGGFDS